MDTFVNSFRKTTISSIDQNIFNDFFGRNSHEKYVFDATNEFAIPKFEFPACHNPIEFLKAHTDENSKEEHRIKIEHGTTTLAFKFNAGIVVAADSRASAGTYIASKSVEKILEINPYLLGTMAGGAGDCTFWERELGRRCRLHELRNKERISVAAASKLLTNMIYPYKGMGISMGVMVVGWDKTGPNLFYVDSEGGRLKGEKFSVGSGSPFAYGILDNEYDFDMNTQDALELARRSIFQAAYRDGASGGSINLYHVKETGWEFIKKYDVNDLHWEYQDQPVKKLL